MESNRGDRKRSEILKISVSSFIGLCSAIALQLHLTKPSDYMSWTGITSSLTLSKSGTGALVAMIVFLALTGFVYIAIPIVWQTTTRSKILGLLCAGILALTIVVPGQSSEGRESAVEYPWYSTELPQLSSARYVSILLFRWLFITVLLALFFTMIFRKIEQISIKKSENSATLQGFSSLDRLVFRPLPILLLGVILLLCWTPIILINGPFSIPMDTMVQIIQFRGFPAWDPMMMTPLDGYWVTDHHPFFDTLIYGAFDVFGIKLGNEAVGFIILTWLQAFTGALALAMTFCWANTRLTLNRKVQVLALVALVFVPVFSMSLLPIMKDSTWIPFFTMWIVCFFEYLYRVRNKEVVGWLLVVVFIGLAFLSGMTKKTSLFVTAPATFLLIFFKGYRVKTVISALVPPLLGLVIIPMLIFPMLRVAPGGTQESLGLPMQQIAKTLLDHEKEITDSDIATISKVMNIEKAKKSWKPSTEDPVKQSFKKEATKKEIVQFLVTWTKLAFHYPGSYLNAVSFLRNSFLLGPTYYTNGNLKCGWGPSGGYAVLPEIADCSQSWNQSVLSNKLVAFLNSSPFFSFIGMEGLYVSWIPLLVFAVCILKRKYSNLLFMLPFLFMAFIQLLLPAHQVRYSFGFLFPVILLLAIPFLEKREVSAKRSKSLPAYEG